MKYSALIGFLILASCSSNPTSRTRPLAGSLGRQCQLPVHVKCDVTLGDLCRVTESAVAFWNAQLPGVRLFTYDGTYTGDAPFAQATLYVTDAESHMAKPVYAAMRMQGVIGYTPSKLQEDSSDNTGCIVLSAMFLFKDVLKGAPGLIPENVTRHELGHALGLSHNEWDNGSVMYPQAHLCAMPLGLRQADLTQLQAIYGHLK